jgi:hypothetical protein
MLPLNKTFCLILCDKNHNLAQDDIYNIHEGGKFYLKVEVQGLNLQINLGLLRNIRAFRLIKCLFLPFIVKGAISTQVAPSFTW